MLSLRRAVPLNALSVAVALAISACGNGNAAARTALDRGATGVLHNIARLGSDVQNAQSDLANFPPDLLSQRKDFQFIHPNFDAMQRASTHSACADAGNVEAAAQNVGTDSSLVRGDADTFDDDAGKADAGGDRTEERFRTPPSGHSGWRLHPSVGTDCARSGQLRNRCRSSGTQGQPADPWRITGRPASKVLERANGVRRPSQGDLRNA